jgi:hypothetical protein
LGKRYHFFLPASLLGAVCIVLGWRGIKYCQPIYADVPAWRHLLHWISLAGFVLITSFLFDLGSTNGQGKWFKQRLLLLFLTGGLLRIVAVFCSPDPVNDVYDWHRDATGYLLEGQNPYSAPYDSPYHTPRAQRLGMYVETVDPHPAVYPGLSLLVMLPFRAVGLDVRWANVLAELAASGALVLVAWRRGYPLIGAMVAGIFLHQPRVSVMVEHSCVESFLEAALGWGLLLVENDWRIGYGLLGLGVMGKQFGIALLAPLAKTLFPRWRFLVVGMTVAVAAIILPFLVWDPQAFLSVTVAKHLAETRTFVSITLASGLYHWTGLIVPRFWELCLGAVLVGWTTWRTPRQEPAAPLWMGTSLLIFCLFFTKCFFNYLFLCEYLLLLGISNMVPAREKAVLQQPLRMAA